VLLRAIVRAVLIENLYGSGKSLRAVYAVYNAGRDDKPVAVQHDIKTAGVLAIRYAGFLFGRLNGAQQFKGSA
jgi:hypothetical protein